MNLKKILLFLFIFVNFVLYPQNSINLSEDFKRIINVDSLNQSLIKSNFNNLNYNELFYYYCVVSESIDKFDIYNKWFIEVQNKIDNQIKNDFGRLDINNLDNNLQKKFSENLLTYLHNFIFSTYTYDSNNISQIVEKGEYNCVSSSIIYAIFLKKYGIQCIGIETTDHVFIEIQFPDEKIDVETTNKYGFDPGKKKEVLNDFGKVTGFTYVPAKDYKNRNQISLKSLTFLVYHNLAGIYYQKGNYVKSANLGYIISLGRNDNKGKEEFGIYFNNYLAGLSQKKRYLEAIESIESYFEVFGKTENFINIRFNLLGAYITDWNDYKNTNDVKVYLLNKNNKYADLKNNKSFLEIYFYFIYKIVEYNNSNNNFDKSYSLIKEFNLNYKNPEMENIFNNTIYDHINFINKNNQFSGFVDKISSLKKDFPEYMKTINKNEKIYYLIYINNILSNGNYEKALIESKKLKIIYQKDNDILDLLLDIYVKYAVFLFNSNEFRKSLQISDEALAEFPNNKILLNNYNAFYNNYINKKIQEKDYTNARIILNEALTKFTGESNYLKLDAFLKEKNY